MYESLKAMDEIARQNFANAKIKELVTEKYLEDHKRLVLEVIEGDAGTVETATDRIKETIRAVEEFNECAIAIKVLPTRELNQLVENTGDAVMFLIHTNAANENAKQYISSDKTLWKMIQGIARKEQASRNLIFGYVQEIRLTSIRIYEGYMPIGIMTNQTGEEVGYLSPFRGYSFQVSATFRGDTDLGSSQVFGLNNLLDARLGTERSLGYQSNLKMDTIKAYLLKLAAKEAIDQWCSRTWHEEKFLESRFYRVFKDDTKVAMYLEKDHKIPLMWGATMLDRFIYLCIRWLNPELYETKTFTANLPSLSEKAADYRERAKVKDAPNSPEWYDEQAAFFEAQAKEIEELFAQYSK